MNYPPDDNPLKDYPHAVEQIALAFTEAIKIQAADESITPEEAVNIVLDDDRLLNKSNSTIITDPLFNEDMTPEYIAARMQSPNPPLLHQHECWDCNKVYDCVPTPLLCYITPDEVAASQDKPIPYQCMACYNNQYGDPLPA